MMTCCEKPLLTRFCPYCGKPNTDPLLTLLVFLRESAKKYGREAARREREFPASKQAGSATYRLKEQTFIEWSEALANHIEKYEVASE